MGDRAGWLCVGVLGGDVEDFVQLASWSSKTNCPFLGYDESFIYRAFPVVPGWPTDFVKIIEDEESRTCWIWVDLQPYTCSTLLSVPGKTGSRAVHKALQEHERASLQALLLLFLTVHVVILLHEGQQLKVPLLGKLRALQAAKFQLWHQVGLGNMEHSDSESRSDEDEDEDDVVYGEHKQEANFVTNVADGSLSPSAELLKAMLLQRPPTMICLFQVETMNSLLMQDVYSWQSELTAQVKALFIRCRVLPASQTQPLLFNLHPQQAAVLVPALTPSPLSMHHDYLRMLAPTTQLQGPNGPAQQHELWTSDIVLEDLQLLLAPDRHYAQDTATATGGLDGGFYWSKALDAWPILAGSMQAVHACAEADLRAPTYFTLPLKEAPGRKAKALGHVMDPAAKFLDACTGLAYRFSAMKCHKALLLAWDTYCKGLPKAYTRAVHEAALTAALQVFDAAVRGPASSEYRQQLLADCWAEWNEGRRLCGAVSLTGWPCVLGPHQELGKHTAHSSGKEWVLAPGAGDTLRTYTDPFDVAAAIRLLTQVHTDATNLDEAGQPARGEGVGEPLVFQVRATLKEHQAHTLPLLTSADTSIAGATAAAEAAQMRLEPVVKAVGSIGRNESQARASLDGKTSANKQQAAIQKLKPAGVLLKGSSVEGSRAAGGGVRVGSAGAGNVAEGVELEGGGAEQEESEGRTVTKVSSSLGPCMGLWTLAAEYDQEAGLPWPGFLPSLSTLIPISLQLEALPSDTAEGVLSASHFPTLAESLTATKHSNTTGAAPSATLQYAIRNWPGHTTPSKPGGVSATGVAASTSAADSRPHVLSVPRKASGLLAGTRSKGQARSKSYVPPSQEATCQILIGLEYGNWNGQRIMATPGMLGFAEHAAADTDADHKAGSTEKGKHKGRMRDKEMKEAGRARPSVTAGWSAAHHILSCDVPLFLDPSNLPEQTEQSGISLGKPSAVNSQQPSEITGPMATRFQLQRIHIITPDVPLTFCSKPTIQIDLPADRSKWLQRMDLPTGVSGQAERARANPTIGITGSPSRSSASIAAGKSDNPTTKARSAGTKDGARHEAASISAASILTQLEFSTSDEFVLPRGRHSVVVLPLVYCVPEMWVANASNQQDAVNSSGANNVDCRVGQTLRLIDITNCTAKVSTGSLLYPVQAGS